jgi:O-antigen/teichoic acid export membrane protein
MWLLSLVLPRRWFTDVRFSRLVQNVGILVTGKAAGAVLNLCALAVTARVLGPERFGQLALIKAYVFLVETLVTFQSWQALIKYGTDLLERKQRESFRRLIKFGTCLDAGTAVVATGLAACGVWAYGRWRGWDPVMVQIGALYSFTLLFNLSGTPKAVLRLFNKFRLFNVQQVSIAGLKLAGVAAAAALGGGFGAFALAWMASETLGYVLLLALGWRTLQRQGFGPVATLREPLRGITRECPGLWGFVWTTNINTSLKMGLKEVDLLFVGGLLGPAAAGLYKVVKQCANLLHDLTGPIQDALYPEIARAWAGGDAAATRRLMRRSGLVAGGMTATVWAVFLLAGPLFLRLVFGEAFLGAYPVLVWYLFAIVIASGSIALTPTLLAIGRPHVILWTNVLGAATYLLLLTVLLPRLGLPGAGMAYVLYYLAWSLSMRAGSSPVFRQGQRRAASQRPAPAAGGA